MRLTRKKDKPVKSVVRSFVPGLITGGPIFIAISIGRGSIPSPEWLLLSIAGYAGAVALALGLTFMFRDLNQQKEEIRQLRQLLSDEGHQDQPGSGRRAVYHGRNPDSRVGEDV